MIRGVSEQRIVFSCFTATTANCGWSSFGATAVVFPALILDYYVLRIDATTTARQNYLCTHLQIFERIATNIDDVLGVLGLVCKE